jgi:hypothetical protein
MFFRAVTCPVTTASYTRFNVGNETDAMTLDEVETMARFDGSLALKFDFGESTTTATVAGASKSGLRLAAVTPPLRGPDKYRILEHRRRQAQIRARRLLD